VRGSRANRAGAPLEAGRPLSGGLSYRSTAGGFEPTEKIATGTLERRVIWSKNPDAWLVEVRDAGGNLLGVEIGFDADNVYLDVRELLGPS